MTRTSLLYCTALTATFAFAAPALAQNLDSELDEIIVTGSPLTRSVDEAITGVSVLSGDELQDRLATTIGETLKAEPGVSSTFFGAGASRPILRGQGGDRVRVLNNGIGSIDASSASPDHAVAAEPAQAERIEVLRGAALLRYGSSGAGGVVNVIDGRIPTERPEGGSDVAVRIGGSTVDDGRELAISTDQALGNFVLHLDGTYKKTDDYDIPGYAESAALRALEGAEEEHEDADHDEGEHDDEHDHEDEEEAFGTLENSFTETKSLTGGLSYIGERGHFGIAVQRFESDYGIPGGHGHEEEGHDDEGHEDEDHEDEEDHDHDEEHGEEEELVTIGLQQTRVDVNASLNLDGFIKTLQLFGGYADYEHTEFEGSEIGTVFANEGYEIRGEAIQKEQEGWRGAYGLQIREREFSAIGDEAFVPPTKTNQYGLYTFQEKEMGDLHLEGAVRFERTDQENSVTGETVSFDGLSVSAGGDFHLSDAVRMGGTVFRTQRAPTTEELFSNGPHLATEQFELGDSTLGLETATGVEAAFRHREAGHFLTLNLFYTDYSDYVFERATGEEEDGLDVFQFTAQDATFKGFEVQGGADLATFGTFDVSVDGLVEYVRAETDSGNLPRIPPLSLLGGIEAESDSFKFRAELDYAAEQNDISEFELATEEYALTNLFVTWKTQVQDAPVRVSVSLMNAFDQEARQHTSFLKDSVPLPGRNVRFSIGTRF